MSEDYGKMTNLELVKVCRERGLIIKGNKADLVGRLRDNPPIKNIETPPEWYTLNPIPFMLFLQFIRLIYNVLEAKTNPESKEDEFAKEAWKAFHNLSDEESNTFHKEMLMYRAYTMAWGVFHQNLMSSFEGWTNCHTGHESKCDLVNNIKKWVAELKNNVNTMNSDSQNSVIQKLVKQKNKKYTPYLVIINGGIKRKTDKHGIEWISGKDFYAELSGRESFMSEILTVTNKLFKDHKTFKSLYDSLEHV
jgi:hypothetical protein